MTVRAPDGNKFTGSIPAGVNVKPGDEVRFDARVQHRDNTFKRPTRFVRNFK